MKDEESVAMSSLRHSDDSPIRRSRPERPARKLLIVDDSATARRALHDLVEGMEGVDEVIEASDGCEALEIARTEQPLAILMDIDMPGMDGIETTREIRKICPATTTVIGYSGTVAANDIYKVLEAGAVGFTVKWSDPEEMKLAVAAALEGRGVLSTEIVRPVISHYVALLEATRNQHQAVIESLAAAVEAKDAVTSGHLRRVTQLAVDLAGRIDESVANTDEFTFGCLLHDVGKIGVPEDILSKPEALDDHEWEIMREHPATGVRVVEPLGLGRVTRDVILHHHERWDGDGYPARLEAESIPLPARIFSVCDALDAMISDRPYRDAMEIDRALVQITQQSGRQFDPMVVESLVGAIDAGELSVPDYMPAHAQAQAHQLTDQLAERRAEKQTSGQGL